MRPSARVRCHAAIAAGAACCAALSCGVDPPANPPQPASATAADIDAGAFPRGFMWGAGGSAHQNEGDDRHSDWWQWELEGHTPSGDASGVAADFLHRYEEDFDRLTALHLDTYRMSLSWARLYPQQDMTEPDADAVAYYDAVFAAMARRGIRPVVSLQHFAMPQWISEQDRWATGEAIGDFKRLASFAARRWGGYVDYWLTINEPEVLAVQGWLNGAFPPGKHDAGLMITVLVNFMRAHAEAYRILHREDTLDADGDGVPVMVGVAKLLVPSQGLSLANPIENAVADVIGGLGNAYWFALDQTGLLDVHLPPPPGQEPPATFHDSLDFIGINYYSRQLFRLDQNGLTPVVNAGAELSDLDKETYPQGLYDSLAFASQYGLPLFVTENGVADAQDRIREGYVVGHLAAMSRFMRDRPDVPVLGYVYWALTDNFEWENGFAPRFGLYAVDYATQQRTLRPSAAKLGELIATLKSPPASAAR